MTPQPPTIQELDIKLRQDLRIIKDLSRQILLRHHLCHKSVHQLFFVTDCLHTAKTILNSYPASYLEIPRVQIKFDRTYSHFLLTSNAFLRFLR